MKNKEGISLIIVTTAVVIMLVLMSAAVVVGNNAIVSANFDEYISSIRRVSDSLNAYYIDHKQLPVTGDVLNVSSLPDSFKKQLSENNDLNNNLYIVNVELLNDSTIDKGKGTLESQDVFLVSEETNNVYYLKGFKYKSKVYYGVE